MKNFRKLIALMLVLIAGVTLVTSCVDEEDPLPSVKLSEKKILVFKFNEFSAPVLATIDHNLKTITAIIPSEVSLTKLSPVIEISEKATISPASGTASDFSKPVSYTVTAEDGSMATYLATIALSSGDPILLESMDVSRTLTDRGPGIDYIVKDMVFIGANALLTVEPGVTISFASVNAGIVVGEDAGLKMVGTAEKPITLTGPVDNNNKGSWSCISYNSARGDNLMEFVHMNNAGTLDSEAAIYLYSGGSLRMSRSSISGSLSNGIKMNDGTLPVFKDNKISDCENYPIWNGQLADLVTIGSSNSLENNGMPYIFVDYGTSLDESLTLSYPGVPIRFNADVSIYKDLNLEKGVILEFNPGKALYVRNAGMLKAIGDAQNPIIFRGSANEAGYWTGISIESGRNSLLEHCIVSGGGYDYYSQNANIAMWDESVLTLANVKLVNSSGYGFQYGSDIKLTHSGVTFEGCAKGNVYDYHNEMVHTNLP